MKVSLVAVMAFLESLKSSLKKSEPNFKMYLTFPERTGHVRQTKALQSCYNLISKKTSNSLLTDIMLPKKLTLSLRRSL